MTGKHQPQNTIGLPRFSASERAALHHRQVLGRYQVGKDLAPAAHQTLVVHVPELSDLRWAT